MKILFDTLRAEFLRVLLKLNMAEAKATQCATIFAGNSRDGVYTHGLNRFPTFVEMIKSGAVDVDAAPELKSNIGLIEQWDGNLGPGMLNATLCMARAIELSKTHGIGCVAVRNTNHWMRGGTYGWQAAEAGCLGICFTNTTALIPPWGGIDPRLGNNPLVIAVPREDGHIVLDMAISQYSWGKMMQYKSNNEKLPLPGGYDADGKLSTNATAIMGSQRVLPIGFWKGSGLSLMLDLLVTILSEGKSTQKITESGKEASVSQVFICTHQPDTEITRQLIEQIVAYTKTSRPEKEGGKISYPGENTLRTRKENMRDGIPVDEKIWEKVRGL